MKRESAKIYEQEASDNFEAKKAEMMKFLEKNSNDAAAKTDYGEKFTSVVARDNIFGVQFHPKKSQKAGRIILKNFLDIK